MRHGRITTKRVPDNRPESIGLGLVWEVLGDLAGLELEVAPAGLGLGADQSEGEGAPSAPGELCVPPGPRGFEDPGTDFSVLGLEGLSAFGDSPLFGKLCIEGSRLMSRGTLCRGSQVTT
jgi:hypothetical protein